jgi:hypothetical protein
MGDRFGSVSINGQPYRIDLQTYRARDVTDFAPRATTPGGGIIFSELNLYQPLNQTDWRHGFGFYWHTDASGYGAGYHLDTRHAGVAMPFTCPFPLSTTAPIDITNMLYTLDSDGKDFIFGYGPGGCNAINELSVDTGAVPRQLTGSPVNMMWTNGSYIFMCEQSTRLKCMKVSNLIVGKATAATNNTLVDTTKTWTDDQFNGWSIVILSGTAAGYARTISDTVGSTKTITISENWTVNPDTTSYYVIYKWVDAGVDANAKDYSWMIAHDGYVYAGVRNTNQVYFDSTEDLSDLHGTLASDPDGIEVGIVGRSVLRACSYNGDLYFARVDGLYKMDKDRSAARKVLDYSDQIHPYNFLTMIVFNGNLIFPIGNQLYQWNGVRVTPITPPRLGEVFPYTQYSKFRYLTVYGNFMFAIAKRYTSSTDNADDLLAFDGVGWHKLWEYSTTLTNDYPIRACSLIILREGTAATRGTGMWLIHQTTSSDSDTRRALITSLNMNDEFPYSSFSTTEDSILYSSRFDAGFRRIVKSTPSILIEASNLQDFPGTGEAAPSKYIQVYYRTNSSGTSAADATSWLPWGGQDGYTNRIKYNGITEMIDPLGQLRSSTIEYYWLELKFVFKSEAASCPILEGLTIRLIMRPDTDYGFSFNVYASETVEYGVGRTDDRTAKKIIDDLRITRDSKAPIMYIDPFEVKHWSYITSVTELAIESHPEDMGPDPNIEHVIQINLVDAGLETSWPPHAFEDELRRRGGEIFYA